MMGLEEFLLFCICMSLLLIGIVVSVVALTTPTPQAKIITLPGEDMFYDPKSDEHKPFANLFSDQGSITLSIIVPAYNEELRLGPMLEEAMGYLTKRQTENPSFTFEVIIVDDGSKDKTKNVALEYSKKYATNLVRVLELKKNRGKGGAVRLGVLRARGDRILFADADGASKFKELERLEKHLDSITKDDQGVACGSRAHLQEASIAKRTPFRTLLMYGFHAWVYLFGVRSVKDTQCGFKLFTRNSARTCFGSLHIERWAFDVELLKIAEMTDIPVGEISIEWTEIDGSKLDPVSASIQMAKDLFLLWLRYKIGLWRLAKRSD